MFQTPPPPPGTRALASNALRKAGLMDRDERMRDASDKPGGRKGSSKFRHHRPRLIDTFKDSAGPSRSSTLASRIAANSNEPLAIRGAARPTAAGRVRRNAISINSGKVPGARPSLSGSVVEVWREFVQKRWNPEQRFLDLGRMSEDQFLRKHRVTPPGAPGSSAKESSVIFKLASQLKPPVQSLSLANNNIQTTQIISSIAHYLPDLANLSLENNALRVWRDIDSISQVSDKKDKLLKLRELILIGNPIRELEVKNNRLDSYRNNIIRRFPTLEVLDQEPITKIAFNAPASSQSSTPATGPRPTATTFPAEMVPTFMTGVPDTFIINFLTRFLTLFDNQRAGLLDVYHDSATFSFQANTTIPVRARIQGFQYSKEMPHQRNLQWPGWLDAGSRNLTRVGGRVGQVLKSIHIGREDAIKAMTSLPQTRHDVSGAPEKFSLDAWPVAQGDRTLLFLSIHGQFTEVPVGGVRSFDRTFALAEATPGSRAKANGWDFEVYSDQLVVRAYSSHEAWKPGPLLVQAQGATPATVPAGLNVTAAQLPLVMQLSQHTGLTPTFALDCLQNNDWDMNRAMANFEQVKGTLGREAFV
ncbi:hypothetical protein EWM64_g7337 [Hericium alpestre]|uniref:NTF2-like protein n=1 Tax=Hericium alpestre TaxID=135208 RepID=A0A4Y9ZQZ4_9AGAM|nr:hypothetical protein EWM64_g7337 [Hericium alpestre]